MSSPVPPPHGTAEAPATQRVPLMDPQRTYASWGPGVERALVEVLRSHTYVRGPQVRGLEDELAARWGARHGVAVGSGTQALVLALQGIFAARPATQREVVVPTLTFFATAGAVIQAGGVPVFADVDPHTFLLDASSVEERASPRTAALVPVHLFGTPCDVEALRQAAVAGGAEAPAVLEDAAQAADATWQGQPVGGLGDAGAFSFYPSKNLAAAGDAGVLLTNDEALAEHVRRLREHGQDRERYTHHEVGTNGRMDEMQAAVLRSKLTHLRAWTAARQAQAARYDEAFRDSPLAPQHVPAEATSARHLYVVRAPRRDALRQALAAEGVATGVYYPLPLHRQPCFASWVPPRCPVGETLADEVLALPCFPGLTDEEQGRVIEVVMRAVGALGTSGA